MEEITCGGEEAGKTLKQLGRGYFFSVNVVKVIRGSRHHNMPSGDMELRSGDRLVILGKPENLRSLRLRQNRGENQTLDTLHQFIYMSGNCANSYITEHLEKAGVLPY